MVRKATTKKVLITLPNLLKPSKQLLALVNSTSKLAYGGIMSPDPPLLRVCVPYRGSGNETSSGSGNEHIAVNDGVVAKT